MEEAEAEVERQERGAVRGEASTGWEGTWKETRATPARAPTPAPSRLYPPGRLLLPLLSSPLPLSIFTLAFLLHLCLFHLRPAPSPGTFALPFRPASPWPDSLYYTSDSLLSFSSLSSSTSSSTSPLLLLLLTLLCLPHQLIHATAYDDDPGIAVHTRGASLGPTPIRRRPQLHWRAGPLYGSSFSSFTYLTLSPDSFQISLFCKLDKGTQLTHGFHPQQVSTYSFETHSKTFQIRVLNIRDGSSHLVSEDTAAGEPIWIGETEVAFIKNGDNGCSMLLSQDVYDKSSA